MSSSDLDLDTLIHNSAMDDSADNPDSTQDWSHLGTLWPEQDSGNTKPYGDIIDFNMASNILDMDLGMGLSAIEPSALHFDSARLYSGYDDPFTPFPASASPADILSSQFSFNFHGDALMDTMSGMTSTPSTNQRRLSITSSSSSSGPSFSPAPESAPSPAYSGNGYTSDSTQQSLSAESSLDYSSQTPAAPTAATEAQPAAPQFFNDPAAELAHRVRQAAGVLLAVPMTAPSYNTDQFLSSAKLPIPRLQRPSISSPNGSALAGSPPKSTSPSSISSAASTPPPSTPSPPPASHGATDGTSTSAPVVPSLPVSPSAPSSGAKPKTSHTTIERRYRTNLNARIQSLRMAVPALRVLEYHDDSKKIKKNLKGGVLIKSGANNAPNGAGTVIAVPGEPSPSNPYGEIDVIDERGFVDGVKVARKCSKANVLGKAVEYIRVLKRRELRLRAEQAGLKTLVCGLVGGPALVREWEREWKEKFGGEEKDEAAAEGDVDDDGEEEEDDEEEEEDGETGRKRKRVKSEKDVFSLPKAKPAAPPITIGADGQPEKRKRGRPRKIPTPSANPVPAASAPTAEQRPQQYLLAVFALFSFFNSPLTSSSNSANHVHKGHVLSPPPLPLAYAPQILSQFTPPASDVDTTATWHDWVQMAHLAITVLLFLSVLSRMAGSFGFGRIRRLVGVASGTAKNAKVDEQVERMILGAEPIPSFASSLILYRSLSDAASPITKALFLYSVACSSSTPFLARWIVKTRARSIWEHASAYQQTKKEDVILSVTVNEAFAMLSSLPSRADDGTSSLSNLLATHIIKSELGRVLGKMFVREVNGKKVEGEQEPDLAVLEHVIEAAKEVGGDVSLLAKNIQRISSSSESSDDENDDDDSESEEWDSSTSLSRSVVTLEDGAEEGETNMPLAFLHALVLYRSLFVAPPGSVEPPTPTTPTPTKVSRGTSRMQRKMYVLRKLLGSQVFDVDEVEDARDKVVDLLVETERMSRTRRM